MLLASWRTKTKELKNKSVLDLKAGSHLVTVVIARDAGEMKAFRAELLEGAAVVE